MTVQDSPPEKSVSWHRRRWRRFGLMLALPLVLVGAGGYMWATGGRYVSTENASVREDKATIASEVAGRIAEVAVAENVPVHAGDLLFRVDAAPYRIAVHQAEAALSTARLKVDQLRTAYREVVESRRAAEQDLAFRRREYARQETLKRSGVSAQAKYDAALHARQDAEQKLAVAEQAVASARAGLGGDPDVATDDHPAVREAQAHLEQARLDLDHTVVRSPSDGVVSQTARLQLGQYLSAGVPVVTVVKTGSQWVEANLKETDLTYLREGQPATVELDAYPGRKLRATVSSIGAGTGAEFSLLPAENASGNWVKVVQRVPVRLKLDAPPADFAMRTGLSADVEIDTGHVRGLPAPIRSALAMTGVDQDTAGQENAGAPLP